jgi:hypothetical protein
MADEEEPGKFVCSKCGSKYKQLQGLSRHKKNCNRDESSDDVTLACKVCHKQYSRLDSLKRHTCKGKPQESSYICHQCNPPKDFLTKYRLERHESIHTKPDKIKVNVPPKKKRKKITLEDDNGNDEDDNKDEDDDKDEENYEGEDELDVGEVIVQDTRLGSVDEDELMAHANLSVVARFVNEGSLDWVYWTWILRNLSYQVWN